MFLMALNLVGVPSQSKVLLDGSSKGHGLHLEASYERRYNDLKVVEDRISGALAELNKQLDMLESSVYVPSQTASQQSAPKSKRGYIHEQHVVRSGASGLSGDGHQVRGHSKSLGTKYRSRSADVSPEVVGVAVTEAAATNVGQKQSKKNKVKPEITSTVLEDTLKKTCPEGFAYYEDRCRKMFTTPMQAKCDVGGIRLDNKCVTRSMVNYACPDGFQRGAVVGRKTKKVLRAGDLCYKTTIDRPKVSCSDGYIMDRTSFAQPTCKREYQQEVAVCSRGSKDVNGECTKVIMVGRECPDDYVLDGEWCIKTYEEACPKTKKYVSKKEKTEKGETFIGKKDKAEREHAKAELFSMIVSHAKSSGTLGDHVDKIFAEPKARSMTQLESVIDKKNRFWDGVVRAEKAVREKGGSDGVVSSAGVSEPNKESKNKIYVRRAEAGYIDSDAAKKELKKIRLLEDNIWEHKIEYLVKETTTAVCEWERMVPAYKVVQETPVPLKIELTMVLETADPDVACDIGYDSISQLCVKKDSAEVIGSCDGVMKDGFCIYEVEVQRKCPPDSEVVDGECVRYTYSPVSWSWTVQYNCSGCDGLIKEKFRKEKVVMDGMDGMDGMDDTTKKISKAKDEL